MKTLRAHLPFALLLFATLAWRLYLWHKTGVQLYGDMLRYDLMARHLVLDGYLGYDAAPDAFVTPGYPLFVALIYKLSMLLHGGHLLPAQRVVHEVYFAQQILSIVTLFLLYVLGILLHGRTAGFLAALVSVLYLPNGYVGLLLLTEALFIPLLIGTLAVYLYAQRSGRLLAYAFCGVMLGLTTLVRPNVLPLLAVLILLDYWQLRQERRQFSYEMRSPISVAGGLMTLGLIVTLIPWWVRNLLSLHHFVLLSTEAGNPLLAGADPYFLVSVDKLIQMSRTLHESQQTFAIHYVVNGFSHQFLLFAGWYLFGKLPYLLWNPWLYDYMAGMIWFQRFLVVVGGAVMLLTLRKPYLRVVSWTALVTLLTQLGFLPITRYGYPVMVLWLAVLPAALLMFYEYVRDRGGLFGA